MRAFGPKERVKCYAKILQLRTVSKHLLFIKFHSNIPQTVWGSKNINASFVIIEPLILKAFIAFLQQKIGQKNLSNKT
jgi:hypothetical protein